jgi:ATP-dependent DNA ligase
MANEDHVARLKQDIEAWNVFRHACKMGLEGIVSKRLGSVYLSGRSPDWLKFKNPDALIPCKFLNLLHNL